MSKHSFAPRHAKKVSASAQLKVPGPPKQTVVKSKLSQQKLSQTKSFANQKTLESGAMQSIYTKNLQANQGSLVTNIAVNKTGKERTQRNKSSCTDNFARVISPSLTSKKSADSKQQTKPSVASKIGGENSWFGKNIQSVGYKVRRRPVSGTTTYNQFGKTGTNILKRPVSCTVSSM